MKRVELPRPVRRVLDRTGLMRWLVRMRLREPLAVCWRAIQQPRTVRHQWDLWSDYRRFRAAHGHALAPGAHVADGATRALIVSLSDWVLQAKLESWLAKGLQLRGCAPVIVTRSDASWARRYYKVFGFDRLIEFDQRVERIPVERVARDAEAFLEDATSIQAIKHFQYRGVNVGRQVLATITRSLYTSCALTAPGMQTQLRVSMEQAMRSVLAAEEVLDEVRPTHALYLEKDYMGLGSLYDVGLNRGVNTVQWCLAHRDDSYTLKRFVPSTRNLHPKSLSDDTWQLMKRMPWTEDCEAVLRQEFSQKYEEGRWGSFYNRPYGELKTPEQIHQQLGLAASKKTAVVFSHVLWDSTFFWGEDLFDDYAEWLVETVKAACRNPSVNWVIKLHPANGWKLLRENVRGELYDRVLLRERVGALPPHVKLLDPDTDINTFALFGVTDYCITVRGTVGSELACRGIPVLTAGTGRYSGLGFTIDSQTRDAYLAQLARIQDILPLGPAETLLAKKYAYAMFCLRPWRVTSFECTYLPLMAGGHPLDHNVKFRLRSFEDVQRAVDLQAFARWVCESQAADFLSAVPTTAQVEPASAGEEAVMKPLHI